MEHERQLLITVPIEVKTKTDEEQLYHLYQWLHMLTNFGEILNLEPDNSTEAK